jgi:hypothetical protein
MTVPGGGGMTVPGGGHVGWFFAVVEVWHV